MRNLIQKFGILALGIAVIAASGCATCRSSYRRDLTDDPQLREANISYKKAIHWLDEAECSVTASYAESSYVTAQSYISDTIFKLKQLGHDRDIDVSEDIYYCEQIKSETDVKIGKADRFMQKP